MSRLEGITRTSACTCMQLSYSCLLGPSCRRKEGVYTGYKLMQCIHVKLALFRVRHLTGSGDDKYSWRVFCRSLHLNSDAEILHLAVFEHSPGIEASGGAFDAFSMTVVAVRMGADSFLIRLRLPGSLGLGL